MASRAGGIYGRSRRQEDDSDDEEQEEVSRIYELYESMVKPLFAKDKKWFWWNMGFFGAACIVTKTHGLHQMDWMTEYLTKESPLDKAMQTQIPMSAAGPGPM